MKSNSMIDKLVDASLNPYKLYFLCLHHSIPEFNEIFNKTKHLVSREFLEKHKTNVLNIDLSYKESYIMIRQNFLYEYRDMLDTCGANYSLTEVIDEFWNKDDLTAILTYADPSPEMTEAVFEDDFLDELKLIVYQKYDVDDVLDKISAKGINSLNVLNKYVLEQKSRD